MSETQNILENNISFLQTALTTLNSLAGYVPDQVPTAKTIKLALKLASGSDDYIINLYYIDGYTTGEIILATAVGDIAGSIFLASAEVPVVVAALAASLEHPVLGAAVLVGGTAYVANASNNFANEITKEVLTLIATPTVTLLPEAVQPTNTSDIHFDKNKETLGENVPLDENENPLPPSLPSLRTGRIDDFKDFSGVSDGAEGIQLVSRILDPNFDLYLGTELQGMVTPTDVEMRWGPLQVNFGANPGLSKPDPLVIDLDGDGVELVNVAASTAFFDVYSTGTYATRTGWVAADDGMLVMDLNDDGVITTALEMFHTATDTPLDNLLAYDTNTNNLLDASDDAFADFRIWRDLNQDGVSDTGELFTLAELNIQSIALTGSGGGTLLEGNLVSQNVTVTFTDTTTTTASEVAFAVDAGNSIYTGDYDLKLEAIFLPHLRGGGFMPNLHIAVSIDEDLMDMVRDLDSFDIADMATFKADLQDMLFRWADVETVETDAHGDHIDGRIVEFLNAYFGIPSVLLAGVQYDADSAENLLSIWREVVDNIAINIAVQGPLAELFPDAMYSFYSDSLDLGRDDWAELLTDAEAGAPTDPIAAAHYWTLLSKLGALYAEQLDVDPATAEADMIARLGALEIPAAETYEAPADTGLGAIHIGTEGADAISVSRGENVIFAGDGNDTITVTGGKNIIFGGAGYNTVLGADNGSIYFVGGDDGNSVTNATGNDDVLFGGAGNDYLNGGFGNDRLYGGAGNDTLAAFDGDDIIHTGTGQDIVIAGSGNDIVYADGVYNEIYAGQGNDTVHGGSGMDIIYGDSLDSSNPNPSNGGADTLIGGASDDVIYAQAGDDTIEGGTGADSLYGGAGGDTYVFNLGDGQDTITEESGEDRIVFGEGIEATDLTFSLQSGNLIVAVDNTSDQITISNWNQSDYRIEYLEFADGTMISSHHIPGILAGNGKSMGAGIVIVGTASDDTLNGTAGGDLILAADGGDTLSGLGGGDVLFGGTGDDVLSGGAGNDWLYGNEGSDEYLFDSGFGADVILDQAAGAETNHVTFGSGLATVDATFSQVGNDLKIAFDTSTDSLTVLNWFVDASWQTTQFAFDDSTVVLAADVADILANDGKIEIPLNEINGTNSAETINGTAGGDLISALDGDDTVNAGAGDDTVHGGAGADTLYGEADDDTLNGDAGNDWIYGGDGDDHLHGGTGLDRLYGGAGSDTYYFNIGDGEKHITDFIEAGEVNKIVFGAGILKNDLVISQIQDVDMMIEITVQSTGDKIRIIDWADEDGFPINQFAFVEAGQSLTVTEANEMFRTQHGTSGNDTLVGKTLDDIIYGYEGNDTIRTAEGDDQLYGGDGNDLLYGDRNASGADVGSGNDLLDGGAGDDNLYGGDGDDTLTGGSGTDHLRGQAGNDTYVLNMGDGLDVVYDSDANGSTNTILFGAGIVKSDLYIYKNGSSLDIQIISTGDIMRLSNWEGDNPIQAFSFTEAGQSLTWAEVDTAFRTFIGTSGNDTFVGTTGNDILYGHDGNDQLYAGLGADTLYGGVGDDTLYGDHTSGSTMQPNGGADVIYGGDGADNIKGGGGNDTLYGEAGNDTMNGDDGDDTMYGGDGNDVVYGGDGNDYVEGGAGADYLRGNAGDDILIYDANDAQIYGNAGEDTLKLVNGGESVNLNATKIQTIERVDMANTYGDDTITLTIADVLRVSDTDILRITGDVGDEVVTASAFTRDADATFGGLDFAAFSGGGATLYIQLGLDMNGSQLLAA